jgi:hypothetical protein
VGKLPTKPSLLLDPISRCITSEKSRGDLREVQPSEIAREWEEDTMKKKEVARKHEGKIGRRTLAGKVFRDFDRKAV